MTNKNTFRGLLNAFPAVALILLFVFSSISYAAEPGVTDTVIRIGQSADLSGTGKQNGAAFTSGAKAYIEYINAIGGVQGRIIELVTLDDKGDNQKCVDNTQALIKEKDVFLLFGYSGAADPVKAAKSANDQGVPVFAAVSGAKSLRTPVLPNVLNLRAGYQEEAAVLINSLKKDRSANRISVVYEETEDSRSAYNALSGEMDKMGMSIDSSATFKASGEGIDAAAKDMIAKRPDAIIISANAKNAAKFIKEARKSLTETTAICCFSNVNADAMGPELLNKGLGVVSTQAVPFPHNRRIPVVKEYGAYVRKFTPDMEPSVAGLEGFISAKALCRIIDDISGPVTRAAFIKTAESQDKSNVGGFSFSFSSKNHQGSTKVFMTQLGPGGYSSPIKTLADIYRFIP